MKTRHEDSDHIVDPAAKSADLHIPLLHGSVYIYFTRRPSADDINIIKQHLDIVSRTMEPSVPVIEPPPPVVKVIRGPDRKPRKTRVTVTPELRASVISDYNGGKGIKPFKIALKHGRNYNTIRDILKRAGVLVRTKPLKNALDTRDHHDDKMVADEQPGTADTSMHKVQ